MSALSFDTPVGRLVVHEADGAITRIAWEDAPPPCPPASATLAAARDQIDAYFARRRDTFGLPLAPGGTPFQQTVWRQLRAIPYGATQTYGDLARTLGSSPRAVGRACGENPIPIVIPCHRVLAAGGGTGGYSGAGGVATKHQLLALEGITLAV